MKKLKRNWLMNTFFISLAVLILSLITLSFAYGVDSNIFFFGLVSLIAIAFIVFFATGIIILVKYIIMYPSEKRDWWIIHLWIVLSGFSILVGLIIIIWIVVTKGGAFQYLADRGIIFQFSQELSIFLFVFGFVTNILIVYGYFKKHIIGYYSSFVSIIQILIVDILGIFTFNTITRDVVSVILYSVVGIVIYRNKKYFIRKNEKVKLRPFLMVPLIIVAAVMLSVVATISFSFTKGAVNYLTYSGPCGVIITEVGEDSPLSKDVIDKQLSAINNIPINDISDVGNILNTINSTKSIPIKIGNETFLVSPLYNTQTNNYILDIFVKKVTCRTS